MQTLNNNVNLLRLFFNKMANEQRVFGFYCRPDSAKAETAAEKACKFFEENPQWNEELTSIGGSFSPWRRW